MPLLPVTRFVTIKFGVHYETHASQDDIRLGLIGSSKELGAWDIRKCVVATESPEYTNCWIAVAYLPHNCTFEWKWAVMSADKSRVFRWEDQNHTFKTGATNGRVRSLWNGYVDFLPGLDQSDKQKVSPRSLNVYDVITSMMGILKIMLHICYFVTLLGMALFFDIRK